MLTFYLFGGLEFASQLPHDGGAFYTTDTTESSRPHYSASWPPILHAAALWLTAGGYKTNDSQKANNNAKNSGNNTNEGKCSVDSASDRFHLLFGRFYLSNEQFQSNPSLILTLFLNLNVL